MARRRIRRRKWLDWSLTLIGLAALSIAVAALGDRNERQQQGRAQVIDGDSLRLDGVEYRLEGIDAPEFTQICQKDGRDWACGRASRDALRALVRRGTVTCRASEVDRYERWLGTCSVGQTNINETLVREGWAVDYGLYAKAEREARDAGRGIWASRFDRPRDWREANRGSLIEEPVPGFLTRLRNYIGM